MIGSHIIEENRTGSTNTLAFQYLKEKKLPEGTVIRAIEQTEGRGHRENKWESEPGKNLTFSVILYPDFMKASEQFNLSKMTSLAIYDFLEPLVSNACIKWPNDIYVDDDKIAGILIENSILGSNLEYSIIGIGLNINQTLFIGNAPNPTSLKIITGREMDLDKALSGLYKCLNKRYLLLCKSGTEQLDRDYLSRLYRYNEFHLYKTESEQFAAKITGFDPYGAVILETDKGEIRKFGFREVDYVL